MSFNLLGKKQGMMQLFDEEGNVVPCSVILSEPNVVTQIKTKQNDGYDAIQLSMGKTRKAKKPIQGHFSKVKIDLRRFIKESKVSNPSQYQIAQEITVDCFKEGDFVDVSGVSIGKGYQGVIKLHRFAGGPAAHGSGFHRHAGSTGMRTSPGRCFLGGKRASRMGADKVTMLNLKVVKVDKENNLLFVLGAIPGKCGSLVYVRKAIKKEKKRG
jgi:large subunit ribosomal protein L3